MARLRSPLAGLIEFHWIIFAIGRMFCPWRQCERSAARETGLARTRLQQPIGCVLVICVIVLFIVLHIGSRRCHHNRFGYWRRWNVWALYCLRENEKQKHIIFRIQSASFDLLTLWTLLGGANDNRIFFKRFFRVFCCWGTCVEGNEFSGIPSVITSVTAVSSCVSQAN